MPERSVFDRLGPRQLEVLSEVAFGGNDRNPGPAKVMRSLEDKGLIVKEERPRQGRDVLGSYSWTEARWVMPIPVHADFCAWCAEQVEAQE